MDRHAENLEPPYDPGTIPVVPKRRVVRQDGSSEGTFKVKRVKKLHKKRGSEASGGEFQQPLESEDILDDVEELILSIDSGNDVKKQHDDGELIIMDDDDDEEEADTDVEGEETLDDSVIPWMDRYDTTEKLITQVEETLRQLEERGVNLTTAWDMANTARSLLDSADVVQALIYANRSFRLALEVHRLQDGSGGAAS
jgi:hypothetical protein